nr:EF-hand domain pair, serine/threonine-protein kinase Mps1 [Tanacetum cinerariifolium]
PKKKVKVSHAVFFEQEMKQDVKQVGTVEIVKQKRISMQQPKVTPNAKQAHNVKRLLSARLHAD